MNSYLYIQSFFKAILQQSLQIQGRFVVMPDGSDINYDNFNKVLNQYSPQNKYPLCAWVPSRSTGRFVPNTDEWEEYNFNLFFLNTTYYTGTNQTAKRNKGTNTSERDVINEWEEMKVAAVDFVRVLRLVQKGNNNESVNMLNNLFRLSNDKVVIQPISFVGTPRLSGVQLSFKASVFTTCNIQDYESGGLVILPPSDESTFDAELAVVRNEVLNIIQEVLPVDGSLNYIIGNGDSVITTGRKGYIEWGFDALITGWTILSDIQGSIVVDIWKDTYGNFEPTIDDSISGGEKPTLSNQKKNQNLDLSSFNKTVSAGDIWAFVVESVTDIKEVTIAFRFNKT